MLLANLEPLVVLGLSILVANIFRNHLKPARKSVGGSRALKVSANSGDYGYQP
jgi:hypothetical protein